VGDGPFDGRGCGQGKLTVADGRGEFGSRLDAYRALLKRWARAADLIGPGSSVDALIRDSLAACPWFATPGRFLDVGSGAGVPAVPLLLGCPGWTGVLLEPRERRWAFLCEVVRELGLAAEVRRERLDAHDGSGYERITVRGVTARVWRGEVGRRLTADGVVLWWTAEDEAARFERAAAGRVIRSILPRGRGTLVAWQPCST